MSLVPTQMCRQKIKARKHGHSHTKGNITFAQLYTLWVIQILASSSDRSPPDNECVTPGQYHLTAHHYYYY